MPEITFKQLKKAEAKAIKEHDEYLVMWVLAEHFGRFVVDYLTEDQYEEAYEILEELIDGSYNRS